MFKKHKKPRIVQVITLRDARGEILFCAPLRDFEPTEAEVLRLSMEFYGDPAPCHIHRGAVVSRVQAELAACLPEGLERPVSALPEVCHSYFSGYPEAVTVRILEGQA